MPLINRETLVDRPVLVEREDEEDKQADKGEEVSETYTLGDGGGPVINNIEFEKGDYDIVAASNLAGVLATGENEGRLFNEVFRNAAIQLKDIKEKDEDISDLVRFSVEKNVADIGLSESEIERLHEQPETPLEAGEEDEDSDEEPRVAEDEEETEEADESDVDEVEEEIEEVKETNEAEEEETEEEGTEQEIEV